MPTKALFQGGIVSHLHYYKRKWDFVWDFAGGFGFTLALYKILFDILGNILDLFFLPRVRWEDQSSC